MSHLLKEQKQEGEFQQKAKEFKVRVLLDERNGNGQWVLTTQSGVVVTALNHRKKRSCKQPCTVVCFKQGNLHVDGKKLDEKAIKIDALQGHVGFNKNSYQGSLLFVIQKGTCFVINQLPLEDYVYSVLRSESWPGWPLEVNKVFAIASRTYVLAKVLESGNKRPYHIKDTNIHQTYKGVHENETLWKAVQETERLIVTYNKKPILAMFDSCCGGVIPAHLSGVDFKKSPYLARIKPCDFCKPCKIYAWKLELETIELERLLQKKGFDIYAIKSITTKSDKAGAVKEVAIAWAKGNTTLTGRQFYSLTAKIKSFCYSVEKKLKKIIIQGKGYGHHLGICQWGARRMIDHGWNCWNILKFAYPGTKCMKLTLK